MNLILKKKDIFVYNTYTKIGDGVCKRTIQCIKRSRDLKNKSNQQQHLTMPFCFTFLYCPLSLKFNHFLLDSISGFFRWGLYDFSGDLMASSEGKSEQKYTQLVAYKVELCLTPKSSSIATTLCFQF